MVENVPKTCTKSALLWMIVLAKCLKRHERPGLHRLQGKQKKDSHNSTSALSICIVAVALNSDFPVPTSDL